MTIIIYVVIIVCNYQNELLVKNLAQKYKMLISVYTTSFYEKRLIQLYRRVLETGYKTIRIISHYNHFYYCHLNIKIL